MMLDKQKQRTSGAFFLPLLQPTIPQAVLLTMFSAFVIADYVRILKIYPLIMAAIKHQVIVTGTIGTVLN